MNSTARLRWMGLLLAASASAMPVWADELKVHFNQVTLERQGPKSAVVEYAGPADGGRFSVLEHDEVVFKGALQTQAAFADWGGARRYFLADYSALRRTGTYRLRIELGGLEALSEEFSVRDDAAFSAMAEALVGYFRLSRSVRADDHHLRVWGTQRYVDAWGGWRDAGGDSGKYLSHLSYSNYFNPQQAGFADWAIARAYLMAPARFRRLGIERAAIDEALWGADFLHRMLSPEGYFYMTVFDRWAAPGAERVLTAYSGIDGVYSEHYQAAFREGAGVSIAALAQAARLGRESGIAGAFTTEQYLADARRAFEHLQQHNLAYDDDGQENIIDDYTALLAATELYRATQEQAYLQAARRRALQLQERLRPDGSWRSDAGSRPFYHAADAGFPVLSLTEYAQVEPDAARRDATLDVVRRALGAQLELDRAVANPYDYPRQRFQLYVDGQRESTVRSGFFMAHANETGYWWQGESARLASLALAATLGSRALASAAGHDPALDERLAAFAQHQLDWTLGRNPFDVCLLQGFGARNPPHSWSAGNAVRGGISNGITGETGQADGSGIQFGSTDDSANWRWYEQWIPHTAWFLLAVTAMNSDPQ